MPYNGMQNGYARSAMYKDITELINCFSKEEYVKAKDLDKSTVKPVSQLRVLINSMKHLQSDLTRLYGSDKSRNPVLSGGINEFLKDQYALIIKRAEDIQNLVKNNQEEGNAFVVKAAEYLNKSTFLAELKKEAAEIGSNVKDIKKEDIDKFIADETLENTKINFAGNEMPKFEVFPHMPVYAPNIIPEAIQSCGKIEDIAEFYLQNKAILNENEAKYLKLRIKNLDYINRLKEFKKDKPKYNFEPESDKQKKTESISNLRLASMQTSGNGCWSCSYQLLLQSRGVYLDQAFIRSFRPEISAKQAADLGEFTIEGMIKDKVNSPFEFPDLITDLVPNTAIHNASFTIDMGNQEAYKKAESSFKELVNDAINKNNSPVAFSTGRHFLTIVGYNEADDKYIIKDSLDMDPHTNNEYSFGDLYARCIREEMPVVSMQLNWLQDIKLENDGTTKSFEKSEFERIQYKNNEVVKSLNPDDENSGVAIHGNTFSNSSNPVGGLAYTRAVYVPKTLNPNVSVIKLDHNYKLVKEPKQEPEQKPKEPPIKPENKPVDKPENQPPVSIVPPVQPKPNQNDNRQPQPELNKKNNEPVPAPKTKNPPIEVINKKPEIEAVPKPEIEAVPKPEIEAVPKPVQNPGEILENKNENPLAQPKTDEVKPDEVKSDEVKPEKEEPKLNNNEAQAETPAQAQSEGSVNIDAAKAAILSSMAAEPQRAKPVYPYPQPQFHEYGIIMTVICWILKVLSGVDYERKHYEDYQKELQEYNQRKAAYESGSSTQKGDSFDMLKSIDKINTKSADGIQQGKEIQPKPEEIKNAVNPEQKKEDIKKEDIKKEEPKKEEPKKDALTVDGLKAQVKRMKDNIFEGLKKDCLANNQSKIVKEFAAIRYLESVERNLKPNNLEMSKEAISAEGMLNASNHKTIAQRIISELPENGFSEVVKSSKDIAEFGEKLNQAREIQKNQKFKEMEDVQFHKMI